MDWQIKGHKKQTEFLENALKRGKLAHAYVFAGPDGVGKKTVAMKLAQALLCENSDACSNCSQCKTFIAQANADYLSLSSDNGIKIEQVRELIYKLSLKPYLAKNKAAIIDNAEEMTVEAANSLLKSLEEPKGFTYIILITSNPNRLPKTISSRAQKITFGPVEFSEYETLLPDKLSHEKKKLINTIAAGKPGLALKAASDGDFLEQLEQWQKYYGVFSGKETAERLITAYDIADMETAEIKNLLEAWLANMRFELSSAPSKVLAKKISQVSLTRKLLEQNVNSKLLLTNLMLSTI